MKGTIRATVKVTWLSEQGERRSAQREKRFVKGTKKRVIDAWKVHVRARLLKQHPQPERTASAGTLAKDAERYYPLIRHLADWVSRRSEIRAWIKHLGDRPRHTITREDVLRIRGEWKMAGVAHNSINNRVSALRNLYKVLDGTDTPTPCDGVGILTPAKVPPQMIYPELVNAVLATLERQAEQGYKYAATDAAWLMVYASSGKRPCEIMRAQPSDVDLRRRVWTPRDAKGGFCPGVYLNDEQLAAWEVFILRAAWGPRKMNAFAERLRSAGWPEGVQPYHLRHSTWIEASERGNDLADIQIGAGHKHQATTRRHYVPVRESRMQRLSESINGRFGWLPGLAPTVKAG